MREQNFGKGAIKSPKDNRDFKYTPAMATTPFDWSVGFDIEQAIGKTMDVKDQNGSGSCGGQAWAYFGQVLDPEKVQKSAKFIYAQDFVLPAGTYGRDNCKIVQDKGWGDEALTPSYMGETLKMPPTEQFMQRKEDITPEAFAQALNDKALSYVNVEINIDSIAERIRDNKGVILGICGENNGTWTNIFPQPPTGNDVWRHWIYCGKAKQMNGKKYIGFLNSWGKSVGNGGWQWIGEEYLTPKYIFETWTLDYNYQKFQFTKDLKFGMYNSDVKELQKRLDVIQTGFFGSLTFLAVQAFQKKWGIIDTGYVGILTRTKLNASL